MTSDIQVRLSTETEGQLLAQWLSVPEGLRWFPMTDQREIDDSIKIWMSYTRLQSSFTADYKGKPVGMAILYLYPYERINHHCLFAIIVDENYRNLGVGRALMQHFEKAAREQFHLRTLFLEVYEGNPAIRLYERMGFQVYGKHPRFIKDKGEYITKVMMRKELHGRA